MRETSSTLVPSSTPGPSSAGIPVKKRVPAGVEDETTTASSTPATGVDEVGQPVETGRGRF